MMTLEGTLRRTAVSTVVKWVSVGSSILTAYGYCVKFIIILCLWLLCEVYYYSTSVAIFTELVQL